MAAAYDPDHPDENVEYYVAKLADLYEKFRPFVERDGLFDASELDVPDDPEPAQQNLFAVPNEKPETGK
jgi:hypothetical protein